MPKAKTAALLGKTIAGEGVAAEERKEKKTEEAARIDAIAGQLRAAQVVHGMATLWLVEPLQLYHPQMRPPAATAEPAAAAPPAPPLSVGPLCVAARR